ncbi:MAG TPA: TrkA family potassium uptake protein [candidate division Zixibacteria bacterium]|nr:TrkA family potassium uptake protein [candidate division Zixibacteria bacterium]
MKKVIIIGAGRFGYATAIRLSELGAYVVVVDTDEKRLHLLRSLVAETLVLDAIDREAIGEKLEGEGFDAGVVAIGDNFTSVLLIGLYLKQFGIPTVVTRASNPKQARILKKIGIDLVVTPEDEMGHNLAEKLILSDSEQIDLSPTTSIIRVLAPKGFIGKSIEELEVKEKGFHLLFVARSYTKQGFVKMAFPDEVDFKITSGDYVVLAGDTRRIAAFVESAR